MSDASGLDPRPDHHHLRIRCVVALPDGTNRVYDQHTVLPQNDHSHAAEWRRHSFRRFERGLVRELIERGWLYGSTIGDLTSEEWDGPAALVEPPEFRFEDT